MRQLSGKGKPLSCGSTEHTCTRVCAHGKVCAQEHTDVYAFFKIINKLLAYIEAWKIKPERGKGKGIKTKHTLITQIIFQSVFYFYA